MASLDPILQEKIKDVLKAAYREKIRQSIIDDVNFHQQFIAAWRKVSFTRRAAIEKPRQPHRKRFKWARDIRRNKPRLKLPQANDIQ